MNSASPSSRLSARRERASSSVSAQRTRTPLSPLSALMSHLSAVSAGCGSCTRCPSAPSRRSASSAFACLSAGGVGCARPPQASTTLRAFTSRPSARRTRQPARRGAASTAAAAHSVVAPRSLTLSLSASSTEAACPLRGYTRPSSSSQVTTPMRPNSSSSRSGGQRLSTARARSGSWLK